MRVLIIDDEEELRLLLLDILEVDSVFVTTAENCLEGWNIIQNSSSPFDLIFIDWNTPEMTGIELVKLIRSTSQMPKLIMTTGLHDMDNIKEAMASGANEYLMKPYTVEMVFEKIEMTGVHFPNESHQE